MRKIKISNRLVGEGEPCFIIAEIGSNHDGKLEQAKKLVNIAKESGADAVKFQTFKAEKIYSSKTPTMTYLKKNELTKEDETVQDLMRKIEMPTEWIKTLAEYCQKKKIIFLSTPFDIKAVDELEEFVPAYLINIGKKIQEGWRKLAKKHNLNIIISGIYPLKPEIIFTHYEKDLNIDHKIIYRAVITATRPLEGETVKEIYSFEIPSSTEWSYPLSFSPNIFYDISESIDIKLKTLEEYKSELRKYPHPRSLEGIKLIAKTWGMKVGMEYAEVFKVVRIIK